VDQISIVLCAGFHIHLNPSCHTTQMSRMEALVRSQRTVP